MNNSRGCLVPLTVAVTAFVTTLAVAAAIFLLPIGELMPVLTAATSRLGAQATLSPFDSMSPPAPEIPATVDASATPPPAKELVRRIGTPVSSGSWQYTVTRVEQPKTLKWGQYDNESDAAGIWLLVYMRLRNIGQQHNPINVWDFYIEDSADTRYDPSNFTFSFASFKGLSQLGDLYPPRVAVDTVLVFDVSPSSRVLQLHVAETGATIDLGR